MKKRLHRSEVPGVECHRANIGDLEAIEPAREVVGFVPKDAAEDNRELLSELSTLNAKTKA